MNNTIFIRPHFNNANGLCNQLSFLINALLYASKNGIKYVVVDNFLKDNSNLSSCPYSEILELNETNFFLQKYGVILRDKTNTNIDSKIIESEFLKIVPGVQTSVSDSWIDSSKFFDIYNNIVFKPEFYNISNNLITEIKQKLGHDIPINVIHLRIEDDAIKHWAKLSNINPNLFKKALEVKYIYLINKYINKHAFTIVMTYSKNNNVIKYLHNNGYNFFTKKKDLSIGRECNALKDLLLARKMNNFFIGAQASTFTHFIQNSTTFKKCILIDLNKIDKPASVTNK
jgi:hypothetical protein